MKSALWLTLALLVLTRLCHVGVLWPEDTLPLAAAVQMQAGGMLYRDVWYDKPPGAPLFCLLAGAREGWPLRVAGALYLAVACWVLGRLSGRLWGPQQGRAAVLLSAFFLTFWIPAAVIPLASDLLMVLPHAAAVALAVAGRPWAAGSAAGLAFAINPKGLLVLGAAWWFRPSRWRRVALGFLLPCAATAIWLASQGALDDYYRQVWLLGATYTRDTFLAHPWREGLLRTMNWAGFHLALILGAAWLLRGASDPWRKRLLGWLALMFGGVLLGWRFFPRYYFLLLPPLVVMAARGISRMARWRWVIVAALLVPLVRFGPRYVLLAADRIAGREPQWRDLALDRDSRAAARILLRRARHDDTLVVWGYRPEIFVYTRLRPATRFLECQPMTGVFADRHLFQSDVSDEALARAGRRELLRSRPTWFLDGLSPMNPRLAPQNYPELREWLAGYELVARTELTLLYRRRPEVTPAKPADVFPEKPRSLPEPQASQRTAP